MSKNSSLLMLKVWLVAVFLWKVRDAVSAMMLSTPVMDKEVSGEASFTCIRMAKALVRHPATGEQEALSLFVQLTVGVLSHHVVTCTCRTSGAKCSRTR